MSSSPANTCHNEPEESLLPSYEAAVGTPDSTKLPSYSRNFSARFHPYKRPRLKNVDERDRLFNTVFDDEYVPLIVPAAGRRRLPRSVLLIDDMEATQRLPIDVDRAIQLELRLQRLDATILDFIEATPRHHRDRPVDSG